MYIDLPGRRERIMSETEQALRLLSGLENGGMSAADATFIAEELDPVLLYCIIRFLREAYPVSDPAASAVLERVIAVTSGSSPVVRRFKEGERDPISQWFVQDYSFSDFKGRGEEMVALLVDKLES